MNRFLIVSTLLLGGAAQAAEPAKAQPRLPPDPRYKADVLLVVAHPDDDVVIGGYLARIALDEHRRVAVVYCTSGDGGGNAVGNEAGASLGLIRTIEARRAMALYGIENVWFLGAHDTPGQNVLWSLDNWNHGRILDEMVRIVRLTRPEVIMTWLPDYVVGENHADHQASGVIATEAFDLSGDPTQFPEQVSAPRNRTGMMNLTEGLSAWQPKKLYYFSDAFEDFGPYWHDPAGLSPFRKIFLEGHGPAYSTTDVSPSKHESYARLCAEQQAFYLTQEGDIGQQALESASLKYFEYPVQLIFGKSVVGSTPTGDVFENVTSRPAAFHHMTGFTGPQAQGISFQFGGAWGFYKDFWKAHDLTNIADLIPVPEVTVGFKQTLHLPLVIKNFTSRAESIQLTAVLPGGWTVEPRAGTYSVQAGEEYSVQLALTAPPSGKAHWEEITLTASGDAGFLGTLKLRAFTGKSSGLPQ